MSNTVKKTKHLIGKVISDKMNKTVTVAVERRVEHKLYKKIVKRTTKIHAHDEGNETHLGDKVKIVETTPYSKTKSWKVVEVVERAV